MQTRSTELSELNDLLENMQNSLEAPVVMVDLQLQILRFTPLAVRVFAIQPTDITRPLLHIRKTFEMADLGERLNHVIQSGESDQEVVVASGRSFQFRMTPYRVGKGEIRGALLAFTDVTALVKTEEYLRASEQRFQQILEHSPLAKIAVNESGQIVLVNERAENLFGYRKNELLGQPIEILIPRGYHLQHVSERSAYVEDPTRRRMALGRDLEAQRQDGKRFPVEISLNPIQTDQGLMVLCGVVDISDRKQAERALRDRAALLESRNQVLKEFAFVASHDLQEPLRMITGHLQLLTRRCLDQLDEKARSYVGYASDGARRMQALISGLLAYSRIGTAELALAPIAMEKIIDQVASDLGRQIQETGATLTHDDLPIVQGDAVQCRQLLQNLISNAIKFRSAEPPRVHVSAAEEDGRWLVSVCDNGMGIPDEHRMRIFEVFQRLHTREELPGDGLGLSICKRIVERHGGTIRVEAAVDKGSVISFTLPKAEH